MVHATFFMRFLWKSAFSVQFWFQARGLKLDSVPESSVMGLVFCRISSPNQIFVPHCASFCLTWGTKWGTMRHNEAKWGKNVGTLERWNVGTLERWLKHPKTLKRWCKTSKRWGKTSKRWCKTLERWNVGTLKRWNVEPKRWNVDAKRWNVGPKRWNVETSGFRPEIKLPN